VFAARLITEDGQQWVHPVVIPPATQSASVSQSRVFNVSEAPDGAQSLGAPVQ